VPKFILPETDLGSKEVLSIWQDRAWTGPLEKIDDLPLAHPQKLQARDEG
jgi:hypothetical protein